MLSRLSERPTAIPCGLGGTIGIAIIHISKPSFLGAFGTDPERLLEFLLIWWFIVFVASLVTGELKLRSLKSD